MPIKHDEALLWALLCVSGCVDAGERHSDEVSSSGAAALLATHAGGLIRHAAIAPAIDGDIEHVWSTVEPRAIARPLLGEPTSPEDLSGDFRVLWDAQNLYLWVEVNDDHLVREQGFAWEDDAIEIYLDGDAARSTQYDADDFQYVFRWNDASAYVGVRSAPPDPNVRFCMRPSSSGYRLEVSIPWTRLGGVPTAGRPLGLDVHIIDNDDGGPRDGKWAWAARRDDAWEKPSSLGLAALESPLAPARIAGLIQSTPLPLFDGERDAQFLYASPEPIARLLIGEPPPATDLRARWRALHDSVFLYLIVEVVDDYVVTDSDPEVPWEDDAIEVFIDGNGSHRASYDSRDDVQLVFRPGDRTVHLGVRSAPLAASDVGALTKRTSDGYQMEIYLKWEALNTTWWLDKTFGLDIQVDDDDDGGARDHKLAWWAHQDDAWERPDQFGIVRILGGRERDEVEALPSLAGIGDLPGGEAGSYVTDMSAHGDVIVGTGQGNMGTEAARWSRTTGLVGLGSAPSRAQSVSPDGRLVAGSSSAADVAPDTIAIWYPEGAPTFLRIDPGLYPSLFTMTPFVVLDDQRVYGNCRQYRALNPGFACSLDDVGRLQMRIDQLGAIFAADSGGAVAGVRYFDRLQPLGPIATLGHTELGYPSDVTCEMPHDCSSEARAIALGGAVVVGTSRIPAPGLRYQRGDPLFSSAFIRVSGEAMKRLPDLAGGEEASGAYAVSADGSVVAGYGTDASGRQATVWTNRSARRLADIVTAAGGEVTLGWRLLDVVAISDDAHVFAGNATNPAGEPEGFRVALAAAP